MNSLQNGPDFILGGAMKAGTSTIRRIIEHSEQVFLPEGGDKKRRSVVS